MKKLFLLLMFLTSAFMAHAENSYAYLIFETTDGTKISVPASSLAITVSGNTLTTGEKTFKLSNLSKMYFSNTEVPTGIKETRASEPEGTTEIYDLKGRKLSKEQLQKGIYIIKEKKGTYKIIAR